MNKSVLFLLLSIFISGTVQAGPIYGTPSYPSYPTDPSQTETNDDNQPLMGHGGVIVGNGGYTFSCTNSLQLQSYDYTAARIYFGSYFDVRETDNTTESLQRIHAIIAKKLPALKKSYDEFVSQLYSQDTSKHYVWQENSGPRFANSNWTDVYTFSSDTLPLLCPGKDVWDIFVQQAILRAPYPDAHGKQVIFYYDPALLPRPGTQTTFLLVHEWLWNYTDDLNNVIRADYLLHSTWIEKASSKEVVQAFNDMGIR